MAFKVAILGAECTGKTTLAQALADQLQSLPNGAQWLPEALRTWCALHQRTPQAHEQLAIAQAQLQAVHHAAPTGFLLADTSPLLTAIYSDLLFQDSSLYPMALEHQKIYDLTLVTGLDIAWVPDGLQRDGPQAREAFDSRLREVLQQHALPYAVVYGQGPERTACALQRITHLAEVAQAPPKSTASTWRWPCEKCSVPECEHQLFSRLLN